ncbi:MAG: tetratricopeptide repeat protein [Rhizobiaceae bacterium]|nr:tetratricopeptide repeat protein [Rhizobiaceae bacterium]
MQLRRASWLMSLAAIVAFVPTTTAVYAKQADAPVQVRSLSGSFLAARVAEADDDLPDAIAYYQKALTFEPDNQEIKQSLLLALISVGRFNEALPYANALKEVPEAERFSRLALAVDEIRKKNFSGAQNMMKLALQSDVDALIAGLITAWSKFGAGDAKGAADYLEKLQGPDWYALFTSYHQALIEEAGGLDKQAEETFGLTLDNVEQGPIAPGTYLRNAEAYAGFLTRKGRKAEALAVLDKVKEFAPGRLPIEALRLRINEGKAIPQIAPDAAAGAAEALANIGTALDRDGGEPLVRLYLNYALALTPENDIVLMQLAEGAEQKEDAQTAIDLYSRVPATSPFKRLSETQLALNLADLDKQEEAVSHLKKLIADDPNDLRTYLALGSVYSSKENFRAAADLYDQAVEHIKKPERDDWSIFYQRGIAYERLKEWPKAEPNFRKALDLFPNQPQVLNYLGYSWIDMDMNLEEGLNLIRRAVDLRPSDGYIVDSLGWAYYKLGRYEEAVNELERAVSLKPEDPVLNDHLGDAYWRAGRQLEATFQWRHARDMKPEPAVLASVEKKLREGLPADEKKAAAKDAPKPAEPPVSPPSPDKKTEAPLAEPEVRASNTEYVVKPGQSLWSIAVDQLGNGERYREILDLNPNLRNPGQLVPGQQLILPVSD